MKCPTCSVEMDCLEDFCGNSKHVGCWFDYCPDCKTVYFGGGYAEQSPIRFDLEPSTDEVYARVDKDVLTLMFL